MIVRGFTMYSLRDIFEVLEWCFIIIVIITVSNIGSTDQMLLDHFSVAFGGCSWNRRSSKCVSVQHLHNGVQHENTDAYRL